MFNVSVIMPVYNVEKYVHFAIYSVLRQSFKAFELIIVNDGSTDNSLSICKKFKDPRVRVVSQKNRGLAGARNTGIRESSGEFIAFIDSDDLWHKDKLKHHVAHLSSDLEIGVSYSCSSLIDEKNHPIGIKQLPKLKNISFKNIICRNPIGNGSSPVIRRTVLDETSFWKYRDGAKERCYFDESFRQSEDIEYWLRIALKSKKRFEGIAKCLTYYRINSGGLSANLSRQFLSWERAISKATLIAPHKVAPWTSLARAYQLRYLARHAIKAHSSRQALELALASLKSNKLVLSEEPVKTFTTLVSAICLRYLPERLFTYIERLGVGLLGRLSPLMGRS